MKKKIIGAIAIFAIAAVAAFNLNIDTQDESLSAIGLENVEALAYGESAGGQQQCFLNVNNWFCGSGGHYYCLTSECGKYQY